MGLETATYISGLTPSWPLSGDTKSQGDDHLRLIKATLQASFPNSSKPFYVPRSVLFTTTIGLDATSQNGIWAFDTTSGELGVTLPSSLTTTDAGWECTVLRTNTSGTNGITVSPASGTILSAVGATATIRIERFEPVRFVWSGSGWYCFKPGDPIGSSINWDGATVLPGYRVADGTAYSTTTFAELNAALGTATLVDKRGRVEAGVDNGAVNRLTATYFGVASSRGSVGGLESNTLAATGMPVHYHAAGMFDPGHTHGHNAITGSTTTGGGSFPAGSNSAATISPVGTGVRVNSPNGLDTTYSAGSGAAHANVQPTIITNKLVRVC